jgi:GTPase Era involved in 16S rRNA processing
MNRSKKQINLFIVGEETLLFYEAITSIEKQMKKDLHINIINNKHSKNDYLNQYYELIDKGKYFNVFAVNYKTKNEIIDFFESFNKNYNETEITSSAYPFFLIDRNVCTKIELYNEIKKINSKRDELYRFFSKDIISYDNISVKDKIFDIYLYYFQKEIPRRKPKTLNIMVCGKKGTGKTYFINELLFENRGLSKENYYTTNITGYEHKLFPIMLFDFPGFSDNEDKSNILYASK